MAINKNKISKRIFLIALLITVLIFLTVFLSKNLMDNVREKAVVDRMNSVISQYEDMQTLMFMSEYFGSDSTCIALETSLDNMNKDLWDLGIKIDQYRQVTEEFMKDPFYIEQKKSFNRREVLYFSMLIKMKQMCSVNQTVVSFFYKKKELCQDCDSQSFVLTDIKKDSENNKKEQEMAIFSFDTDMDIPSVNMLLKFYNITEFPCVTIEKERYCGLHDKKELIELLCKDREMSICPSSTK
jgi:hypothetical protein